MDRMLSVKEVQELIGCGRNKIYAIIGSRTMRCIKIGKQYYIPESEYIRWVNNNVDKTIVL